MIARSLLEAWTGTPQSIRHPRKAWVVLHDQKLCGSPANGHELEEGVGTAHIQLRDVAVQPAEDAE